jgi:hypothetical protein
LAVIVVDPRNHNKIGKTKHRRGGRAAAIMLDAGNRIPQW